MGSQPCVRRGRVPEVGAGVQQRRAEQLRAQSAQREICNGADDDCDGALDNGLGNVSCGVGYCARSVAACVLGDAGVCMAGSPRRDDATASMMAATTWSTTGSPTSRAAMARVSGRCRRATAARQLVRARNPVTETCNNVDDDCNGTVDNMPNLVRCRGVRAHGGGVHRRCRGYVHAGHGHCRDVQQRR